MKRIVLVLALVFLPFLVVRADEIEFLSGSKRSGKIVKETATSIYLKFKMSGTKVTMGIPKRKIHAITKGGVRRVINKKKVKPKKVVKKTPPKKKTQPKPGNTRTKQEVEKLIARAGKTKPQWWNKVSLQYPKTLLLSWPKPPNGSGWNTRKNIGQYVWSVINENTPRWKDGVKFLHYVKTYNQKNGNQAAVQKAHDSLGGLYHNLLEDWARAAYFWRLAGRKDTPGIADCYFKLGNKDMAMKVMRQFTYDGTRHGAVTKMFADMGEYSKALKMAQGIVDQNRQCLGYLMMGDIYRLQGKFKEAENAYRKGSIAPAGRSRDYKVHLGRAKNSLLAVQVMETLNLKRIRAGKYTAKSLGYSGDLFVEVTVSRRRIVEVKITRHVEKQYYSSLTDIPAQILKKQGLKGIIPTTAATLTAEAIINATAKALAQGLK